MSSVTLLDVATSQLHPPDPCTLSASFPPVVIKQEPIHLTEEDFRESLRNTWLPDIDTNVAVNLVATTNSTDETDQIIKKEYSSFLDGTTSFHDLDKNQSVIIRPTNTTCSICHKRFYDSETLNEHQKSCNLQNTKSFLCGTCNKVFSTKSRLNNHSRIHSGIKPYSCSVCTKPFADRSAYIKHEKIHFRVKEEKVECNLCGGLFSDAWGLKKHQLTHSGERPYQCPVCNKTFRTSSTLVVHKRMHTGEKPYPCTVCEKRFTVKTHLVTHSRTHSGERPYECTTCGRAFSDRSSWRRHSRRHNLPEESKKTEPVEPKPIENKIVPTQPFFENFHRFILEHQQLLDDPQRFKFDMDPEPKKSPETYPYFAENQPENEFKYKTKTSLGTPFFNSIYNAAVTQPTTMNFIEDLNSRNQI